jgi:hypothetical protein
MMPKLVITVYAKDRSDLDWIKSNCLTVLENSVEVARDKKRIDDEVEVDWNILMRPEPSREQLPLPLQLYGCRWKVLVCSDCDPKCNEASDDDAAYEMPFVMLISADRTTPDLCPRCTSLLSLCEAGKLEITAAQTTP